MNQLLNKIIFKLISPLICLLKKYSMKIYIIYGDKRKVIIGNNVSLSNTLLNVSSGMIFIGENTIFGHNCMILTGIHQFQNGMRKKLFNGEKEAPENGYDIHIGSGCWIASGSIIIGNVTIGDNVIVAAGSVVTKDIPSGYMVGGVPAKIIKKTKEILC